MTRIPRRIPISREDLAPFLRGDGLPDYLEALLAQQTRSWAMARRGYESLATVQTRRFEFDGFQVKTQFNPGRLISSSARVDSKSISERPCFLCGANLPADQKGLLVHNEYLILCNPFPIFPEHFTISHIDHRPQDLLPALAVLIDLARELSPRYTMLYNGPRCGASAPDHLHLQAGLRGFMPFEAEVGVLEQQRGEILSERSGVRIFTFDGYLRTFLGFRSSNAEALTATVQASVNVYRELAGDPDQEPMMNLLVWFDAGEWTLALFPRSRHRPSFFFEEGEQKLLLSPAAVDVGGVCTLPIEKDFRTIAQDHLVQMFSEVSLESRRFEDLKRRIRLL